MLYTPEAHEAAYKGAVTDALKRALRHFGDEHTRHRSEDRSTMAVCTRAFGIGQ